MDDGAPSTLSVGFAIDTEDSFAELAQLQTLMGSAEAKVVQSAASIERATTGMLNMGPATAQISALGNATSREMANAAQSMARATKAGEALSAQMQRQAETFGMSRAAAAAYRAEQAGNIELADRLRAQEAGLTAMRTQATAAMRAETIAMRTFGSMSAAGASAATGLSAGMAGVGRSSQAAQIEMLEMSHIGRSLAEQMAAGVNPIRALSMETGRFLTAVQYGGAGVGGFVKQFASMLGIIKVVRNAELEEAAAAAVGQAAAIAGTAARAKASIAAAEAEIELALAAQRVAATDVEATAAAGALAAAREAQAIATTQATIAENALAVAEGRATEASTAAAAASKTMIGGTGVLLGTLAVVAGVAFGAFKQFQDQVKDSGELTAYRDNLGLTHKEMLQLSDGVDKAGGKIKELSDVTVTAGDVMHGLWKTISDGAATTDGGKGWAKFKGYASDAFNGILNAWSVVSAGIDAGIWGTVNAAKVIWKNFASSVGDVFYEAVNFAINAMNKLVAAGTDILNGFIHAANKVPGVNIGDVSAPQISQVANPYARANDQKNATAAANEIKKGYADAYAAAKKADQSFWDQVKKNSLQSAKDRMKAEADALKANETAKKPKKQSDHGVAEALAQLDAAIKGQWALAAAYQVSDAAAMKAEALQKAEEDAIKHKGDTGIFYEKELAKAVATAAAEGAKRIADLSAETTAQKAVNDAVSAGILPASQMSKALQEANEKRRLTAALAVAEEKGWIEEAVRLRAELENLGKTQAENNAQANRAQVLAATSSGQDQLDKLALEATLIGRTNEVRAVAIAQLEAEKFLRDHPGATLEEAQKYVQTQQDIAQLTAQNATAQELYNKSLAYAADLMQLMDDRAQTLASTLSDAFGSVGSGLGQAITALTKFSAEQAKLDEQHAAAVKAGLSDEKEQNLYRTASLNNQIASTAQLVGGLKAMFAAHSAGYKAMQAAEEALAIVQLVQTARSVAAGAAKMFAQLGPWAFPVVGAMLAVMAGLGFGGGGSSGSSGPPIPNVDDLQAKQGAGTVLGDASAKSDSIAHSLDLMSKNSVQGLNYSSEMVRSLRSIETGIEQLTGNIARQVQVGNLWDSSKLKLGTFGSGGFLGIGSSSQVRTLADQGIIISTGGPLNLASHYKNQALWNAAMGQVSDGTVAQILANGVSGASYTRTDEANTKGGILGAGGGSSSGVDYDTSSLNSSITGAFTQVIGSIRNSLVSAANIIGVQGAAALIDAVKIHVGQISFEGMSGSQIEDQLNAVFSNIGDQMAGAISPALTQLQKVGEGLFETFMRVSKDYATIDAALSSIGMQFGSIGVASLAARERLIDLAGTLDDFVSQTDYFFNNFFSDADKVAFGQAQIGAAFGTLGLAVPASIEQFKNLVQGLDLSTDAGQSMFEALMQIAPAFHDVAVASQKAADDQKKLQVQLLQAQGRTDEATALQRQIDLEQVDASNRALQQQVWAAQDAQAAAQAADDLRKAWQSVGDSIMQEVNRIRGLSDPTGANSFASILGQFNAATTAARGGDQDAAKTLPQLSQSLLTAAANAASSRQELDRIQAETAASLQATYALITSFGGAAAPVTSDSALIAAAGTSQASSTPANDNPTDVLAAKVAELLDEVTQLRADNNAGHAANASNTSAIKRKLDDVTADSGGNAISTVIAA